MTDFVTIFQDWSPLKVNQNQNCKLTSLKVCSKLLPDTDRVMSMWCMMKRGSSWLWYGKQARLSAINSSMLTSVFCRKNKCRENDLKTAAVLHHVL